jgi:hypothetical protein
MAVYNLTFVKTAVDEKDYRLIRCDAIYGEDTYVLVGLSSCFLGLVVISWGRKKLVPKLCNFNRVDDRKSAAKCL